MRATVGHVLTLLLSTGICWASDQGHHVTQYRGIEAFGYTNHSFYVDGHPFQILGGQMDPQRVPRELWQDRLVKAKALGLNTIFSYIYWNELETSPGVWDWQGISGMNDIGAWYQSIQDAGLYAVLRPGPYVCGERDWGGFPAWLSQISNLTVRTNNPQFLGLSDQYLGNLSEQIGQYQVTKGGPILLAQVENEYGEFGDDYAYTQALSDIISKHFDILQYTNDGGSKQDLDGSHVHDVLEEIDGNPYYGFGNRTAYVTDPTSQGPQLDGEYYTKWLTTWGPNATYPMDSGIGFNDEQILEGLRWILQQGGSFSLYMFHGGSNFAFGNGGLNFGQLEPVTSSYDYAAPLDESGRPRSLYWQIQQVIQQHTNQSAPTIPETPSMLSTAPIPLTPAAHLFDDLPASNFSGRPLNMEALGQSYGYTLYRYIAPASAAAMSGFLKPGDVPRDRVLIYLNGTKHGVIDAMYQPPQNVSLEILPGTTLDLLIENQGRVDYSYPLFDQRKGIVGDVYIGSSIVGPWQIYSYPVPEPRPTCVQSWNTSYHQDSPATVKANDTPVWYTGTLRIDPAHCGTAAADTYLTIQGGTKGVLYVNGYNLGRYWTVGPQQSQYVPGAWLQEENNIVVLELEPQAGVQLAAQGSGNRSWYNNPDPDCPGCTSTNPN